MLCLMKNNKHNVMLLLINNKILYVQGVSGPSAKNDINFFIFEIVCVIIYIKHLIFNILHFNYCINKTNFTHDSLFAHLLLDELPQF